MDDLTLPDPVEILLQQIQIILTEVRALHQLRDLLAPSQDPLHEQAQENLGMILRQVYDRVQAMTEMQDATQRDIAEINRKLDILLQALRLPTT